MTPARSDNPGGDGRGPSRSTITAMLRAWLPRQRWFGGDADAAATMRLRSIAPVLDTADLAVDLVLIGPAHAEASYQVLLAWRGAAAPELEHARIGVIGDRWCYDALHDEAVTDALYAALATGAALGPITTHRHRPLPAGLAGTVLGAEQSNTSVVFGDQVIIKFFRRLVPGINPDAEIAAALDESGYTAHLIGDLCIDLDGTATTLGLATAFAANAADGWSMATTSVRDLLLEADLHADEVGGDFGGESFRLGVAVAQVHRALAGAFGTTAADSAERAEILGRMLRRARRLTGSVPALRPSADRIEQAFARLAESIEATPMIMQRIHGDLHLGQVLRTVDGWLLIDFEGEPARPLAARRALDSPMRDIAGMLRSFHYAADHLAHIGGMDGQQRYRATEWVVRNRDAFLDGYTSATGADPREQAALLTAFELDKAIYEVAYEHDHRPGWESTPLAAVAELTEHT